MGAHLLAKHDFLTLNSYLAFFLGAGAVVHSLLIPKRLRSEHDDGGGVCAKRQSNLTDTRTRHAPCTALSVQHHRETIASRLRTVKT